MLFDRLNKQYFAAAISMAMMIGGCAKSVVDVTEQASLSLPRPDMIIVNDFAVSPAEVKLDKGVLATAMRDGEGRMPNEEEYKVGHIVANKLSEKLVEELTKVGIKAVRATYGTKPSATTAVLSGQFVSVDQGNQTERVWIGFGLGGTDVRTEAQVVQAGKVVARAKTSTKASLKPGMVVGLATGSAAGTVGASAAMGAAGAGFSETFLAGVDADASRTAKELAEKIRKYYVDRGWL